MKKLLLILSIISITIFTSGCATWEGVKQDSQDVYDSTKEATSKAYDSTKDAIHNATK